MLVEEGEMYRVFEKYFLRKGKGKREEIRVVASVSRSLGMKLDVLAFCFKERK
jgi:hypothetical protein